MPSYHKKSFKTITVYNYDFIFYNLHLTGRYALLNFANGYISIMLHSTLVFGSWLLTIAENATVKIADQCRQINDQTTLNVNLEKNRMGRKGQSMTGLTVQFRCNLNAIFLAIWQKNSHQMQAIILSHNQSQSLQSTSRLAHKRCLSMRRQPALSKTHRICVRILRKNNNKCIKNLYNNVKSWEQAIPLK